MPSARDPDDDDHDMSPELDEVYPKGGISQPHNILTYLDMAKKSMFPKGVRNGRVSTLLTPLKETTLE